MGMAFLSSCRRRKNHTEPTSKSRKTVRQWSRSRVLTQTGCCRVWLAWKIFKKENIANSMFCLAYAKTKTLFSNSEKSCVYFGEIWRSARMHPPTNQLIYSKKPRRNYPLPVVSRNTEFHARVKLLMIVRTI